LLKITERREASRGNIKAIPVRSSYWRFSTKIHWGQELGWTETREQANNVARQLQRISHIARWSPGHMHAGMSKIVVLLDSTRTSVSGAAYVWKVWKKISQGKESKDNILHNVTAIRLVTSSTSRFRSNHHWNWNDDC
jgi:hypothetical protein